MTRATLMLAAPLLVLALVDVAAAQGGQGDQGDEDDEAPGVEVRVSPYRPADVDPAEDPGARYLYQLELTPRAWPTAEVVADRRLLHFEVHPEDSRRRYRCRHPDAPRRVDDARVVQIGSGADRGTWREWIDLRMYCWGRAMEALEDGARLEVTYGFRRRGRDRWVVRRPGGEDEQRRLEAPDVQVPAAPQAEPTEDGDGDSEGDPVRVELRRRDVGSGGWVTFSVALKANEGSHHVYLRDDLLSFVVDGPLGRVVCEVPRQPIVPIVDFYKRLRGRRAARTSISAERWCPEGTFGVAGVYDVTAVADLVYDGHRYDIDAVTGRIVGEPTPFRVRRDDHGYVEHTIDSNSGDAPSEGGAGINAARPAPGPSS